jgi:hypothetical protein
MNLDYLGTMGIMFLSRPAREKAILLKLSVTLRFNRIIKSFIAKPTSWQAQAVFRFGVKWRGSVPL